MFSNDGADNEIMRVRLVLLIMLVAFVFLACVLWREQVLNAGEYTASLDEQSIRMVRLPASRGRIFDRNGVCLADNRPSFCIALYLEELRRPGRLTNTVNRIESVISQVSNVIGVKREVSSEDIMMHLRKRRPMEFLAWRDIDQKALARWAENSATLVGGDKYLPGVDIYVEPVRFYPHGHIASHILGFVGRVGKTVSGEEEDISYDYYLPAMEGKRGIEKVMNEALAGEAGGKLLRVDASGFRHEVEKGRDPFSGRDVILTIDFRIQTLAQEALEGERGAIVILNPSNGDVLALASSPDFDPNDFSPNVSPAQWRELIGGYKPLQNRAIAEVYAPGSIFKPVVAIASMESGKASRKTSFNCPGYFSLGGVRFRCWQKRGHGWLDLRGGIEQSCNAYFCQLGLYTGYEHIYHMASAMGLGKATGIELGIRNVEEEAAGLLPDNVWKKRVMKDIWRKGDTCNLSIGQGALNVTPIQMALVVSAIANGGRVYRPRIIMKNGINRAAVQGDGDLVQDLQWSSENARFIRGAMRDVIESDTGTGKRAKVEGYEMAGKTGTAEFGTKENRKLNTWMIVFAPFEEPRYAIAMMIEEGVSGGYTVAPRIKKLMEGVFALENNT